MESQMVKKEKHKWRGRFEIKINIPKSDCTNPIIIIDSTI